MTDGEVKLIAVPKKVEEQLEKEAYEKGIDVELLIIDKLSASIDPETRKEVYAGAADVLLSEAFNYFNKGDLVQASEKGWGACASVVKAYGEKLGVEHYRHRQLEEIMTRLVQEMKRRGSTDARQLIEGWGVCLRLHSNFYEGFMSPEDVEESLNIVKGFVGKMKELLGR